jgi:hypothetical protein
MTFKRFFRGLLFYVPAFLVAGQVRRLYLDSCGPRSSWQDDFFGPCSEAIGYLIMAAIVGGLPTLIWFVAPRLYKFFFDRIPLFGKENGAGSVDPAPPRTP